MAPAGLDHGQIPHVLYRGRNVWRIVTVAYDSQRRASEQVRRGEARCKPCEDADDGKVAAQRRRVRLADHLHKRIRGSLVDKLVKCLAALDRP